MRLEPQFRLRSPTRGHSLLLRISTPAGSASADAEGGGTIKRTSGAKEGKEEEERRAPRDEEEQCETPTSELNNVPLPLLVGFPT